MRSSQTFADETVDVTSVLYHVPQLQKMDPEDLEHLIATAHVEVLEEAVTLFRQGDRGTNWYLVLTGTLLAFTDQSNSCNQTQIQRYSLGSGCGFGESVVYDSPRPFTAVTTSVCQLLRVEQKHFIPLWKKNQQVFESLTPSYLDDTNISSVSLEKLPVSANQREVDFSGDTDQKHYQSSGANSAKFLRNLRPSVRKRFLPVIPQNHRNSFRAQKNDPRHHTQEEERPETRPKTERDPGNYESEISLGRGADLDSVQDSTELMPKQLHSPRKKLSEISPSQTASAQRRFNNSNLFVSDQLNHQYERRASATNRRRQLPTLQKSPQSHSFDHCSAKILTEKISCSAMKLREIGLVMTNKVRSGQERLDRVDSSCKSGVSQHGKEAEANRGEGKLKRNKSSEKSLKETDRSYTSTEETSSMDYSHKSSHSSPTTEKNPTPQPSTRRKSSTYSKTASTDSSTAGCYTEETPEEASISYSCDEKRGSSDNQESGASTSPSSSTPLQLSRDKCEITAGNNGDCQANGSQLSPEEKKEQPQEYQHDQVHPIFEPSSEMIDTARTVRIAMQARCAQIFTERRLRGRVHRNCLSGKSMTDWLTQAGGSTRTRHQAAALWQVLLENGLISHVEQMHSFKDKNLLYRFRDDIDVMGAMNLTTEERRHAEASLSEAISVLQEYAASAVFRAIVRKQPANRTEEEVEILFEHLIHVKALNHLTNSVRKELARAILFEYHAKKRSVLFQQGDEGHSWYIILRGSVDVVIRGKGAVTSLFATDDFGNLALINDAPRAATIICREDNCHFLRVNKADFNRILRNVEANTVRLKEHGKDVLVLEKLSSSSSGDNFKYCVMAGTPQKMLEHLLETRFGDRTKRDSSFSPGSVLTTDTFLDDFLLTHTIFFPFAQLADELLNKYRGHIDSNSPLSTCTASASATDPELTIAAKRAVLKFLHSWVNLVKEPALYELSHVNSNFLQELYLLIEADAIMYESKFSAETNLMMDLMKLKERASLERQSFGVRKWKTSPSCNRITLFSGDSMAEEAMDHARPLQPQDEVIFRVYSADHTFCTLKSPLLATSRTIRASASDKLGVSNKSLLLVELKSSGEKQVIPDECTSVPLGLSLNGRLFIIPQEHLDALIPLDEQQGPRQSSSFDIEAFSTRDIAAVMAKIDWDAFSRIHEFEVLYHVMGRCQRDRITANLDMFISQFNLYQHWVTTEICLCSGFGRRQVIVKKFIKLAAACRDLCNLNAFFAIVMGLCNSSVTRLQQTWDRIPTKLRRTLQEFEVLLDPSRNHRAFRVYMASLRPPIIPLLPLIIKDMTFINEGNRTHINHLVNFEKMHMLAQSMRTLRYCCSRRQAEFECSNVRAEAEIRRHFRTLHVIDNQKTFDFLSRKLESQKS